MRKKIQWLSVTTYILLLLSAVLALSLFLIGIHSYRAQTLLLERICANTQDTVALYQKQMDKELDKIETWMYTLAISNADYTVLTSQRPGDAEWYGALAHMRQNFASALSVYTADGFLLWLPESETFLDRFRVGLSSLAVQNALREKVSGDELPGNWEVMEIENGCYLVRVLHTGKARVAALADLKTLLSAVGGETAGSSEAGRGVLYLAFGNDKLSDGRNVLQPDFEMPVEGYEVITAQGEKMLVVQQPLENGDIRLAKMIPYAEIQAFGASLKRNFILVIGLFIAMGCCQVYLAGKQIIQPVTMLTDALERMSTGRLEQQIPISGQLREYRQMSLSFNEMVTEIRDLKIDVYEERIHYQELENQYLKQQITPHFMINCLNTAYQLTEPDQLDLARSMLVDLSRHLRYTLSSGQIVPLCEELQMVRNYVEMSSIRYPECLTVELECPEEFSQAAVVPLLVLNFAENTVKYQVSMGSLLEIHVRVTGYEEAGALRLHILIWDSGKGFPAEVLLNLADVGKIDGRNSAHIGIANVILRMRRIYPEARFAFSNRIGAGAQIDIDFPFRSCGEIQRKLPGGRQ